jgi:hypothetical protein
MLPFSLIFDDWPASWLTGIFNPSVVTYTKIPFLSPLLRRKNKARKASPLFLDKSAFVLPYLMIRLELIVPLT